MALAHAISTPVILSGGVSQLSDLEEIAKHTGDGIDGAIVGRALYDGAIDAAQAVKMVA